MGCIEACSDEILALGLGDTLGNRQGAWRMGEGFGTPWAITRRMGGDCDILGNREWEVKGGDSDALGDRKGTQRCGGEDCDAWGDRERNCRSREGIRTPCMFARAIGGQGRGLGRTGQSQGEWEIGGVN